MEISKQDSKMLKGVAVLGLLMLHLFCRKTDLPYTPLIWIGETPLIYYFGLFGDFCVPIFCFVSGYAHYMQYQAGKPARARWRQLLKFFVVMWILAALFAIAGLVLRSDSIPGSPVKFLLNCLTVENSYNGAWWYANTYLLLVVLQPLSTRAAHRMPAVLSVSLAWCLYVVGYAVRFPLNAGLQEALPSAAYWAVGKLALLMTSYFTYTVGMVCRRYGIVGKLRALTENMKPWLINILAGAGFLLMFAAHAVVQTAFVAVFTGLGAVCLLCVCRMPRFLEKALCFLGDHSSCIWLSHMFFYGDLFGGFVFRAVWVLPIFLLTLTLSLAVSFAVRFVSRPLMKLISKS